MSSPAQASTLKLKRNLLVLHLESISRLTLAFHRHCFPNLERLLSESMQFENYFSSATSTLMVLSHLFHGNDFELDHLAVHDAALPAGNARHLFAILKDHGYGCGLACLNLYHDQQPTKVSVWPDEISVPYGSADPANVMAALDSMTQEAPFAVFFWNLISHIEHSGVYAYDATSLTDRLQRAYRHADAMIGELLRRLHERGTLADTVIVVYGDHGDDFWAHGFKGGMVHAVEPYANMVWAPLAFWSAGAPAETRSSLAGTTDIRATCLALLDIEHSDGFLDAGANLLMTARTHVFSQNFMANQPDDPQTQIKRTLAVYNDTYCMMVNSRGIEMYAYRLDPVNRCNLVHFLEMAADGTVRLRPIADARSHYLSAIRDGESLCGSLVSNFIGLRDNLRRRIETKITYLRNRYPEAQVLAWSEAMLNRTDAEDRNAFFGIPTASGPRARYRFY
jgi:membrane-anchored protein YejM (alkaline phosphatase superfamily)